MHASKSTLALASFAASFDAATLPAEVRQKLGWLLLDHLRVCSIGARLPWSDWSRRYVGLVGKAGASHVLFSRRHASIRSTRPSSTSPSVRASTATTPMSAPCCIPASRPGRRRWRSPSTPARRGRRCWPRSSPATRRSSASGLRCSPSHFKRGFQSTGTCDGFGTAAAAGRLLFRGKDAAQKIADALGHCRRLRQRPRAVLLFRRIGQAHPRGARGRGRRRGGAARRAGLQRAERHHRRAGRLRPRLCRRLQSGADRGRARASAFI